MMTSSHAHQHFLFLCLAIIILIVVLPIIGVQLIVLIFDTIVLQAALHKASAGDNEEGVYFLQ